MANTIESREPYFYFFSVGILSAVTGVAIWILYSFAVLDFYPRPGHGGMMFFSFLGSFVAGFLMTAIPKMTNTAAATVAEKFVLATLLIFQIPLYFFNEIKCAFVLFLLQLIALTVFLISRAVKIKRLPFEGLFFLPFGFLWAYYAVIRNLLTSEINFTMLFKFAGEAFILNLICGVGMRLVPVLSRFPRAINLDVAGDRSRFVKAAALAAFLNFTFILEVFQLNRWAYILRTLFLLVHFINYFGLLKVPGQSSRLGWGFKFSLSFLIIGYVCLALEIFNAVAALHLIYIGGFTLLTLLVATRVTLAHGGKDQNFELKSPILPLLCWTFVIAAIIRFLIGVHLQTPWFSLLPALYIGGLLLWSLSMRFAK